MANWTQSQTVQQYQTELWQGDTLLRTFTLDGNVRNIQIRAFLRVPQDPQNPWGPSKPQLRLKLRAKNGEGENAVYSDWVTASYCLGDVNGDGVVDGADVSQVENALSPPYSQQVSPPLSSDGLRKLAQPEDVDWNGVVTADDVSIVKQYLGGSCRTGN